MPRLSPPVRHPADRGGPSTAGPGFDHRSRAVTEARIGRLRGA